MERKSLNFIVTGGLGGIGRVIVRRIVERGDHVFLFDRIPPSSEITQELQALGVVYVCVDLASVASIKDAFAQVDAFLLSLDFDSKRSTTVDGLINNAGVTRDGLALRMTEADWDLVLDVNLKGAFFAAQQALVRMIKKPHDDAHGSARGYIINMSSIVGKTGNPGQVNYAASKAGLIALTQTLAREYASRKILVNAIAPGFIQTPMTDALSEPVKQQIFDRIALKRFGKPDEIADLVLFLSSGAADYITGQVIEVSGGM